jgi:hypothetical protein
MAIATKTSRWIRLEPMTRSADRLAHALSAPVLDPLWMLTRQWQTGEFSGEDGAAPASVAIQFHVAPLRLADEAEGARQRLQEGVAEATLFAEPTPPSWGDRARLGQELTDIVVNSLGSSAYVILDALAAQCPLSTDPAKTVLPGERRAASLVDGQILDGVALLTHLGAGGTFGRPAGIDDASWSVAQRLIALWRARRGAQFIPPSPEDARPADWVAATQRYSTRLETTHPAGGTVSLNVSLDPGGVLGWPNLDVRGDSAAVLPTAGHTTVTVVPSRVRVPGMPASRWWDFEDSARALLNIDGGVQDIGRMMWLEFLLMGCDDWFVAPLSVPRGSLVWIRKVSVTDVFGRTTEVQAADLDARPVDAADLPARGTQRFSLFRPAYAPNVAAGGGLEDRVFEKLPRLADFLVVPPGVGPHTMVGPRLEELRLLRDEDANLVWGLEHTVQDHWGRAVAGRDYHAHQPGRGDDAPLPEVSSTNDSGPLRYRARTPVPAHWTPFVAQRLRGDQIRLRRASLWSESSAPRPIRGRLLEEIGEGGEINEEIVPRSGLRVARELRRARDVDGNIVTWVQRVVGTGSGEGSSGLRFDLALPDMIKSNEEG